MKVNRSVFLGVDISTQGVRVLALDECGTILSSQNTHLKYQISDIQQSPMYWWSILIDCLRNISSDLKSMNLLYNIKAISVTSTSGTVIPIDKDFNPLYDALMYHDKSSFIEANICNTYAKYDNYEVSFNTSYGLPKIVWFVNRFPNLAENIYKWCHPSDYIIGKLSGVWGITDSTNALKTGYDLVNEQWPEFIHSKLSLPSKWFPKVLKTGTIVGSLEKEVSKLTGLPSTIKVVIGPTDGCASQIASGSINPGDWCTTIGTTLVIKGVTYKRIKDPLGRLYCHKHPNGYWMPGGASNTGTTWINRDYKTSDLNELNEKAEKITPSRSIAYPLVQTGERFPFVSPKAVGYIPKGLNKEEQFTTSLEGVAYLERLAYELIEELSNEKIERIHTAGGASQSNIWLQIRSNTLKKPIIKMKHIDGAIGAAVIAASNTHFTDLEEAGKHLLEQETIIEPNLQLVDRYEENFQKFKQLLIDKRYIDNKG